MDNDTTAAHVAVLQELHDTYTGNGFTLERTALRAGIAAIYGLTESVAEHNADNELLDELIAMHNVVCAAWADRAKSAEARIAALEKALHEAMEWKWLDSDMPKKVRAETVALPEAKL